MRQVGNDVSITVSNKEEAADYYETVCGFSRGRDTKDWIQIVNGNHKWYLVDDNGPSPMFNLLVENVAECVDAIVHHGGEVMQQFEHEVFVRDVYGIYFCVEPNS